MKALVVPLGPPAPYLIKGRFLQRLGAPFHHRMQGLQHLKHAFHIPLPEVQTRRLFQAFVPHLVPEDGHADQLLTHLDQRGRRRRTSV